MTSSAPDSMPHGQGTGAARKTRVFLSYSRRDREAVTRLADRLAAIPRFEVFRDTEDILPTEAWRSRLKSLITQADTVVFALSPDSAASEVCAWEVDIARSMSKRIAPVVVREVHGRVPEGISELNYIFLNHGEDFEAPFARLVAALDADIAWIREHTRLAELAQRWIESERRADRLLRGQDIAAAEALARRRPATAPQLSTAMEELVAASRQEAERLARRTRRNRILLATLACLVVATAGMLTWTYRTALTLQARVLADRYWPTPLTAARARALTPGAPFRECASCPEMVVVPSGSFVMGAADQKSALPMHGVEIRKAFAVGRLEVTFDEWDACVAHGVCRPRPNDYGRGRGRMPVVGVTVGDAKTFATWLSGQTGGRYRLLSEAEWEYAARAGTTTSYPWGDAIGVGRANCANCGTPWDGTGPAPAGSFPANSFGLHDMHGNVWEWVEDCDVASYVDAPADGSARSDSDTCPRVVRGGSFNNSPGALNSGYRGLNMEVDSDAHIGFRIARELP